MEEADQQPAGPPDRLGPATPLPEAAAVAGPPLPPDLAAVAGPPLPPDLAAPPPPTPGPPAKKKRWIPRQVKWTITIVALFFILEYLLLPDLASARKSLNKLEQVSILWLILAVALEVCSLAAYAELSHTVLTPDSPKRFTLFRINMSSLAVSHVMPVGTASGGALAYRLLTADQGVPGSVAAFGLATQGVGSAVVLNGLFWFSLLISIPLSGYNPLYGFAAIAGVILIALFAGTVLLLTRGKHSAADYLHRLARHLPFINPDKVSSLVQSIADRLVILLRDRALLIHALEWAALNWILDAASLWLFIFAFGHTISPIDLLVAYGLANILAVIPITPGGLGIVEGVLIPTLVGFHVPKTVAILAVLSYRLVNFWLPIPLGGVAYLSLRFGPHARRLRHRAAALGSGPSGRADSQAAPSRPRLGGGTAPPGG